MQMAGMTADEVPDTPVPKAPEPDVGNPLLELAQGKVPKEHLERAVREDRPWDEVKEGLSRSFGADPEQYRQDYQLQQARRREGRGVDFSEIVRRNMIPVASAIMNADEKSDYQAAMRAYQDNKATPDDLQKIAKYERIQKAFSDVASQGLGGQLAVATTHAPQIVGEALGAGKVVGWGARALGFGAEAAAGAAPTILGSQTAANVGGYLARGAAQTPLMPSFYLEKAVDKNISEGRDAYDVKGFGPALGYAYAQTLVLNSLQRLVVSGGAVSQAVKKGAIGVGEQQGVDAIAGAVDEVLPKAYQTDTKYGTIGKLLDSKTRSEGAKDSIVQMLTFTAFAAAHGANPEKLQSSFVDGVNQLAGKGYPANTALEYGKSVNDVFARIVRERPDITREEAKARFDAIPDGPLKDLLNGPYKGYVDAWTESLPKAEKPPETQPASNAIGAIGGIRAIGDRIAPIAPETPTPALPEAGRTQSVAKAKQDAALEASRAETRRVFESQRRQDVAQDAVQTERATEDVLQPAKDGEISAEIESEEPPDRQQQIEQAKGELNDLFDKAGLTDRERHIITERSNGRVLEDIAGDVQVMKKGQKPYTRERIRQIQQEALDKIESVEGAAPGIKDKLREAFKTETATGAPLRPQGIESFGAEQGFGRLGEGAPLRPEEVAQGNAIENLIREMNQREPGSADARELLALSHDLLHEDRINALEKEIDDAAKELGRRSGRKARSIRRQAEAEQSANQPPATAAPRAPEAAAPAEGTPNSPRPVDSGAAAAAGPGGTDRAGGQGTPAGGSQSKLAASGVAQSPGPREPTAVDAAERLLQERIAANQPQMGVTAQRNMMGQEPAPTGPPRDLRSQAQRLVNGIMDMTAKLGGITAPKTQRLSQPLADKIGEYGSARIYASELAPDLLDKVMGGDARLTSRMVTGAMITETRLRHMRQTFLDAARMHSNAGVMAKDAGNKAKAAEQFNLANEFAEKAHNVITIVGGKTADEYLTNPLMTEADFQHYSRDPKVQEEIKRFASEVSMKHLEPAFRRSQGLEETDPIDQMTQIPGMPFSMVPIREGEAAPPGTIFVGGGRGNLRNPKQTKLGASYEATGSASNGYVIDLGEIIQRNLMDRLPNAAKADMYRTAVNEGVASWMKPGDRAPMTRDGRGWQRLPDVKPPRGTQAAENGQSDLLVHPDVAGEMRQVLGPDRELPKLPLTVAAQWASLASLGDFFSHIGNLSTGFMRAGMHPFDTIRGIKADLYNEPWFRDHIVELARISALREHGADTGGTHGLFGGGKLDPTKYTSELLTLMDRTMRVTAAKAFDRMAASGRAEATQGNKRDFVNQIGGNYNKRTQSQLVAFLRDTGLGPFATASGNFLMQSLRLIGLRPGVRTNSLKSSMRLQAEMLARIAILPAAAVALNQMMWGKPEGDEKTPWGAWKIGEGNGKTYYIDLLGLTGLRRSLRTVGLQSMIEGQREGARRAGSNAGTDSGRAIHDVVLATLHAGLGPPVDFMETLRTGQNISGYQLATHAKKGESQYWNNALAALWSSNQILETWIKPEFDAYMGTHHKTEKSTLEKAGSMPGPFGVKSSSRPPGAPAGR